MLQSTRSALAAWQHSDERLIDEDLANLMEGCIRSRKCVCGLAPPSERVPVVQGINFSYAGREKALWLLRIQFFCHVKERLFTYRSDPGIDGTAQPP